MNTHTSIYTLGIGVIVHMGCRITIFTCISIIYVTVLLYDRTHRISDCEVLYISTSTR